MSTVISLTDLVRQGDHDDHPHAPSDHPGATALEWLGLAVGEMPYLLGSARTVDDINWRSKAPNAARMQLGLIDALAQQLASSTALVFHALCAHRRAHPELGDGDAALEDVEFMSHALVEDHPPLWRRAELLTGGYVTALAAAVQASGRLTEHRLSATPDDGGPSSDAAAMVVDDAITRALATLLGHARLNARDRQVVLERAA